MSTFSIKNAPPGAQSWFITLFPTGGAPILPKATLALNSPTQLEVASGIYPRIIVSVNTSPPGSPEAYLDAKEVNKQTLESGSTYVFDWGTGRLV